MATSFVEYRDYGFWAHDGVLEVWLDTLAEVVPGDAPPWLQDAGRYWRLQARSGFRGFIAADLDAIVASPDQVAAVLDLADKALVQLTVLAGDTGRLPPDRLNPRMLGGDPVGWPEQGP